MLTNKFPIWKISTEKLWRKAKRHHVKPEPTNKEHAHWNGAQMKDRTHPNPPKPLNTDNKANTFCRSYLQCVEMLSRVQHELFSPLLVSRWEALFVCEPGRVCYGRMRVWFLLGRCFPILVTLHHSGREEEEEDDGPGQCDEVPSPQRNSRGPWSFLQLLLLLLLVGGRCGWIAH